MWILLAAVAIQGSAPEAPKKDETIVVTGKAQRVCFQSVVTGSRARARKICTTKSEAGKESPEAVASREAFREAIELNAIRDATKCDALNSNGCN